MKVVLVCLLLCLAHGTTFPAEAAGPSYELPIIQRDASAAGLFGLKDFNNEVFQEEEERGAKSVNVTECSTEVEDDVTVGYVTRPECDELEPESQFAGDGRRFPGMEGTALLPAVLTTALYWAVWCPAEHPSILALVLKVLPTLSLALAVELSPGPRTRRRALTRWGLLASAVGDAALVWPEGFLLGMGSFALGHLFYILSLPPVGLLGRHPGRSLAAGLGLYSLAAAVWATAIRPGLAGDPVLAAGVPIYILWLTTTVWRAAVAGDGTMFLGAFMFMVSDALIGINLFYSPVPNSQVWIMSTYHAAQWLITLAAVRAPREKGE